MNIFYNKLNVIYRLLYLVNEEENSLYLIIIKKYNFNIIFRKINSFINIRIKFEFSKKYDELKIIISNNKYNNKHKS